MPASPDLAAGWRLLAGAGCGGLVEEVTEIRPEGAFEGFDDSMGPAAPCMIRRKWRGYRGVSKRATEPGLCCQVVVVGVMIVAIDFGQASKCSPVEMVWIETIPSLFLVLSQTPLSS
jgi:hypothetical protein